MCFRQRKAKNRPTSRQIIMHLEIAAENFLSIPEDSYFKSQVYINLRAFCKFDRCLLMYFVCQVSWREEIRAQFVKMKADGTHLQRLDEELVRRREEELRWVCNDV